ncbi:MAG: hypothetical protein CM15mP21_8160 [Hyphomicrobiales bacterium]|nr:MAG: hypothetical protein CM15mP21_8160 [Hyphomicrobiales bacterium]
MPEQFNGKVCIIGPDVRASRRQNASKNSALIMTISRPLTILAATGITKPKWDVCLLSIAAY